MPLAHTLLVIGVVFIWGTNFVPIKLGLNEFPPFTFATLRFFFAVVPWILVVPRPNVAWKWLVAVGVLVGPGQFGLLYYAMRSDISPGLASLLVQCQVFFTIALASWMYGEKVSIASMLGLAVASMGLLLIGTHTGNSVTARGVIVVLLSAACWAMGNLTVKRAARETPRGFGVLPFMIWSSLFAFPPLVVMSLLLEGVGAFTSSIHGATVAGWGAVVWQSVGNTLLGFGIWNWLLTKHKADLVAPYALLVPVFGMSASALLLGEAMPPWKVLAASLVLTGIAVHTLWPLMVRRATQA